MKPSPLLVADNGPVTPLRIFALSRAAIWALALTTLLLLDGRLNPARAAWDTPRLHELGSVIDVWARWDSNWYLRIAEDGYSWPSSTPAFFPLYPLLVGGLGRILAGNYVLAGVAVSLAAGAIAFVLLHRLALVRTGPADAHRAVLYLALFPTSLFLGAVYSESLFLALAIGTFLLAERQRLGWAAVVAALAVLTRSQGLALVPALAVLGWREPDRRRTLAVLVVPVAAFLAYPVVLAVWIGHPLAFLDAQDLWERHLSPLGPVGGIVDAVGDGQLAELGFAIGMVTLAVLAWRWLGSAYGLYALLALAIPMSFPSTRLGGLYSFPRLALAAFPCLLALALVGRDRRFHLATVAVLGSVLVVYVVRWSLWYWVA